MINQSINLFVMKHDTRDIADIRCYRTDRNNQAKKRLR